ncbi:GIY-YIG nuclease family protein [Marinobacter sp. S0848L]|uniref:GIY-YIG nuclease family protein n=1 Tax=Marinobacter sp. S0848L TaxID=2926423 RepID=UPI001FF3917F|nr:GIY-YIG nuclease family protein [Marinobacter sp. S0848L]MCK0106846.1 GIY-YIG nuclease family protein [Marinobacter sp. S0848L]
MDLDELSAELQEFAQPKKEKTLTAREERIIAGFEEIQRFVEEHGRIPGYGEDRDIFERLYAVRLDRIRALEECRELVAGLDHQGLLECDAGIQDESAEAMDDDELLAALSDMAPGGELTELRHVRSTAEKRAVDEIANRTLCEDFEQFRPLFRQVEAELKAGIRETRRFGQDASIEQGNFFILNGQMVYVAEVGEMFKAPNGDNDARLRVIYSNETESDILLRSLQRALYKDETGRRITEHDAGPLFRDTWEEDDVETGTIYVLRSKSQNPFVAEHRELIHKIGVTGGKVETRIANAEHDATYLLADVEVVATYKLAGINRTKLEALLHRVFAPAQLDLQIKDRFGHPVKPREWFLVPLSAIDEAVDRIRDGSITQAAYDPETASLVNLPS